MQDGCLVPKHPFREVLHILLQWNLLHDTFHPDILGKLEFNFGNDADHTVASDGGPKELVVGAPTGFCDSAIGQYKLQCAHAMANWPVSDIPSVRVD